MPLDGFADDLSALAAVANPRNGLNKQPIAMEMDLSWLANHAVKPCSGAPAGGVAPAQLAQARRLGLLGRSIKETRC